MVLNKQVGICGEHGGEPSSVAFFAEAGLDYVSCSPFRYSLLSLLSFLLEYLEMLYVVLSHQQSTKYYGKNSLYN